MPIFRVRLLSLFGGLCLIMLSIQVLVIDVIMEIKINNRTNSIKEKKGIKMRMVMRIEISIVKRLYYRCMVRMRESEYLYVIEK